jgi:hypothetical protein
MYDGVQGISWERGETWGSRSCCDIYELDVPLGSPTIAFDGGISYHCLGKQSNIEIYILHLSSAEKPNNLVF